MASGLKLWHAVIHPITGYFRRRRGQRILELFPSIAAMSIADVGGSVHFWEKTALSIDSKNITLFNISTSETQGLSEGGGSGPDLVLYDGLHMPVRDKCFDLVVCNSVIEHVGVREREAFVNEMRRVGDLFYLQTPAWEFPVEPHFIMPGIHWLPKMLGFCVVFISPWWLLSRPGFELARDYFMNTNLLKREEIERLFPDCRVLEERVFWLVKSYIVTNCWK